MNRRTPLERFTPLRARTPLKARPAARKTPRYTGPSKGVRLAVYERDGWRCVCCGQSIKGRPHSIQHRKRRSQGGTNEMTNLITLAGTGTTGCHARIDNRRDREDEAKGYTVRREQDPAKVSVMVFSEHGSGITVWLAPDGTYRYEPPAGTE